MIRVFPRKTRATPNDNLAFIGDPPIAPLRPPEQPVRVSVTFTWDRKEGERLASSWGRYYSDVQLGGPAFGDPGNGFVPGQFVRGGYVITSRGCPHGCSFCFVPEREGLIRELPVTEGWNVLDNNLLACSKSHVEKVFAMLQAQRRAAIFTGGIEARLVDGWFIELLRSIRLQALFTAFDSEGRRGFAQRAIERLREAGLNRNKIFCYVLIGYSKDTFEAAEARLQTVKDWGATPFAMLYRNEKGNYDKDWRRLQRVWCRPAAIWGKRPHSLEQQLCFGGKK